MLSVKAVSTRESSDNLNQTEIGLFFSPWGLTVPLHSATFAGPLAEPLASASAATCSPCTSGAKYVRVFSQGRHLSSIAYIIYPKYNTIWGTIFRVHSFATFSSRWMWLLVCTGSTVYSYSVPNHLSISAATLEKMHWASTFGAEWRES